MMSNQSEEEWHFNMSDKIDLNNTATPTSSCKSFGCVPFIFVDTILAIGIILGNGVVMATFLKYREVRVPANYAIVSLATVDFLTGVIASPYNIVSGYLVYNVPELNRLSEDRYFCLVKMFVCTILVGLSFLHQLFIAIERYVKICHYTTYVKYITRKRLILALVAVWLYAVVISSPPMFGWNSWEPNLECRGYKVQPDYSRIIVVPHLPICICVGSGLYIAIFRFYRNQRRKVKHYASPVLKRPNRRENTTRAERTSTNGKGFDIEPIPGPSNYNTSVSQSNAGVTHISQCHAVGDQGDFNTKISASVKNEKEDESTGNINKGEHWKGKGPGKHSTPIAMKTEKPNSAVLVLDTAVALTANSRITSLLTPVERRSLELTPARASLTPDGKFNGSLTLCVSTEENITSDRTSSTNMTSSLPALSDPTPAPQLRSSLIATSAPNVASLHHDLCRKHSASTIAWQKTPEKITTKVETTRLRCAWTSGIATVEMDQHNVEQLTQQLHSQPVKDNSEIKLAIMMAVVLSTFTLLYLPFALIFLLEKYFQHDVATFGIIYNITVEIMTFSSMTNPIIYWALNKNMRKAFSKLFMCGA